MRKSGEDLGGKRAKAAIAILASIFYFWPVVAQVDSLKFRGDQAYVSEDFPLAIEQYEQILSQEYVSAEVHYNLANAYFKSGRIAPSVLHYERAKKLAPQDEDILFNLKLVNLSVKDRIEEMPQLFFVGWWQTVLRTFSADGWSVSAIGALVVALSGLLVFRFSSDGGVKRLAFYTGVIMLCWTGFSLYAAQTGFQREVNDDRAVVFVPTVNVKSAPDQKGKDLFVIHEGLVVVVSDELNGWLRIRLSNGNVGWIPSEVVQHI